MRNASLLACSLLVALLGGCASPSVGPESGPGPSTNERPSPVGDTAAGASTIEDVWAVIGCADDDPLGTRGMISESEPTAATERTGACVPFEDGDLAFFYELASPEDAAKWLSSGGLEVGPTDAVFIDGSVVILATDARTSAEFTELFEPAS